MSKLTSTFSTYSKWYALALVALIANLASAVEQGGDLKSLFGSQDEFKPVDEAFVITVDAFDNELIVTYDILPSYYLYQHRLGIGLAGAQLEHPIYPDGKTKVDEYFGEVRTYYKQLQMSIPFRIASDADGSVNNNTDKSMVVKLEFQGCAPGLCYPPTTRYFQINAATSQVTATDRDGWKSNSSQKFNWQAPSLEQPDIRTTVVAESADGGLSSASPAISEAGSPVESSTATNTTTTESAGFVSEKQQIINSLNDNSLVYGFLLMVALGIGLAFTPCVFPMMPIISSIIAGQGNNITTSKAFFLSLAYTQGMAIPYVGIGIIVAFFGAVVTTFLQSPPVLIFAAVIFVILAIGMFGFFEIQLPVSLQNKLNGVSQNQESGTYIGASIMGIISAFVVSPCVTIPLIAVLALIAETGDWIVGGVYLYGLAVGMGIPLIIIGVGGGNLLPRAGGWMNAVKSVFGVLMIGIAFYITKHLVPAPIYLLEWAALLIVVSVYMGALKQVESGWPTFWKGVGVLLLIYGILLMIGAAQGNRSVLSPLAGSGVIAASTESAAPDATETKQYVDHAGFTLIKSSDELDQYIAKANAEGKTVMLDFYADYCVACFEFAELTFPDPRVKKALENTLLLQADVTKGDDIDTELMQRFDIFGLPSILFFDQQGKELTALRAEGFEDADTFLARIDAAIGE